MSSRLSVLLVVCFLVISESASAQFGGGGMGGRGMGGMGGGRGGMGGGGRGGRGGQSGRGNAPDVDVVRARRDSMIDRVGFARFVLMNSMPLALADSQVTVIQRLDSLFHTVADTTRERLDSLHAQNALVVQQVKQAPADTLPAAERDSIVARRKVIGQLTAAMRTIQQDTKTKTLGTLSSDQQTKMQAILDAAPSGGARGRHGGSPSGEGGRSGR